MNDIKLTRESLGFSQEHLANYLGIERGLLSMVEIGKRELPTDALLKLNMLELAIPQNGLAARMPLISAELEKQQNLLQDFLQQEQQLLLQKANDLQKQLTIVTTNYEKALRLLQAVRSLQQALPKIAKNERDLLWYALTEAMLLEKINANDLVVQKKLEWEIESLHYKAESM